MLNFIKKLLGKSMSAKKPIKVQNSDNSGRVGIVAKSLSDLRTKISQKFNVPSNFNLVEEDGTELCDNDYFSLLQPQTVLIILKPGESWKPPKDDQKKRVEQILKSLLDSNQMKEITDGVHNLLKNEHDPINRALLGKIAESTSSADNIMAESRKDHPAWFEGLPAKFKDKDRFMRENCRRRVRGYMYVATDYIRKNMPKSKTPVAKRIAEEVLDLFSQRMKENDSFSDYFARSSKLEGIKLCDDNGWFRCEGVYNKDKCEFVDHLINPYASWQNRIVFSTWNLDHRIEKSRQVIPSLVCAIQKLPRSKELNWEYFYDLLFTRENLKLVHIACHDKSEHSDKCDEQRYYI